MDNQTQITQDKKSHCTTLILCFFFGALGLHRIYTGYTLIGIIQFLTGGGWGIWTLVDLISLWTNKYKDSNGNELEGYDNVCVILTLLLILAVPITLIVYLIKGL